MTDLLTDLQASLGSAYRIEREMGGGGMSRVFLAEEMALGRRVVIKVLLPQLALGMSADRFRREITLAARLQHPHLVPLLAAGEVDELPYFTMPYVEGESLRARLAQGALSIAETVAILRDVAQALEYAHSKGVTHRDVKPDNILLSGSSAILADLGVAKALSLAAEERPLTSVGVSVGTPAYMAPEQAAADPATDYRADIYALGVVAYEMLAGRTPFAGRSPQAMLMAHATEVPVPIATVQPSTPALLANLVMQCLAKRPADRPESVSLLVRALETPGAAEAAPPAAVIRRLPALGRKTILAIGLGALLVSLIALGIWWRGRSGALRGGEGRSIAVLPFENRSGDPAFDYLEDGITDQVRDALNAIPGLVVKARSSSQRLKGKEAQEVGTRLGVEEVLQGTVSRSGDRLHVTTELVRTSDDNVLWSRTFEGRMEELAGIQDTITAAVARKLGGDTRGASRGTTDPEAYDLFLRGRSAYDHFEFPEAATFFRSTLDRDPRFARAGGYLAMSYANETVLNLGSLDSLLDLARVTAGQALATDSTVIEAHIAQAFILGSDLRVGEALKPFQRAMLIDSSDAYLLSNYGLALAQAGRIDEAVAEARRAYHRDPLSPRVGILSYLLFLSGQLDPAIARIREAIVLDPKAVLPYKLGAMILAFAGMPDSAVAAAATGVALDSANFGGRTSLLFAYAAAGRWQDVRRERAAIDRDAGQRERNYTQLVEHLVSGEYQEAMTSLERGVEAREQYLGIISIPCDPLFDPLKRDPRFDALLHRIGAIACPARLKWPIGRGRTEGGELR
jgi:serine/threonine-protein kinase